MHKTRRQILRVLPALILPLDCFAQLLEKTPRQTRGPFYPDNLPLDRDNDLIIVNDSLTHAVGEILHLSGTIYDTQGRTLKNAAVEIWQTDNNGHYIHSGDFEASENDQNFQGYGIFQTDSSGRYRFRTIRPVAYGTGFSRRTPHIHFSVAANNYSPMSTQLYFADEDNRSDGLWSRLSDTQKSMLTRQPVAVQDSVLNEQAVSFDIILG